MKVDMGESKTDKPFKMLSKEAFRALLKENIEATLKRYEGPIQELAKKMKELERMIDEAQEQTSTLNRAADVIIRHQESFLYKANVLPKRTVGVNVNIVPRVVSDSPAPETKNSVKATPIAIQNNPAPIQIKTEPDVASAAAAPAPSNKTNTQGVKRSSVDVVDLTSEDEKANPKQLKTFAAVDKSCTRLFGALTREPINSKSQPVLIQDNTAFPSKFTAVPVSLPQASALPQVFQLTQSQLNTLSGGNVIAQPQSSIPKTVARNVPAGQHFTYLVQSSVGLPPQGTSQATRPNTVPTAVATARVPANNPPMVINATRGVAPPSGAIIVRSKMPGSIFPSQNLVEQRVVLPMPSNMNNHPAPLPEQPKPPVRCRAVAFDIPPKPTLKISKPAAGIVLSWNLAITRSHAPIKTYQLYGYEETNGPADTSMWKKVGEVKALPLPMACTLTQFAEGRRYHFAIRAMDIYYRIGSFSDIASIYLKPSPTNQV